jgi:DNA-directed RNA polymerase alpha subunit
MFDPVPNLPDATPIETVRFSTIVRNGLLRAGFKTIGEVRATADNDLRRKSRFGPRRLAYLRRTLGIKPEKAK